MHSFLENTGSLVIKLEKASSFMQACGISSMIFWMLISYMSDDLLADVSLFLWLIDAYVRTLSRLNYISFYILSILYSYFHLCLMHYVLCIGLIVVLQIKDLFCRVLEFENVCLYSWWNLVQYCLHHSIDNYDENLFHLVYMSKCNVILEKPNEIHRIRNP